MCLPCLPCCGRARVCAQVLDEIIKAAEALGVPINDIITPFALAQDQNLYEQLSGGIRWVWRPKLELSGLGYTA